MIELRAAAYWITRRSLSSGAHSRDPLARMTAPTLAASQPRGIRHGLDRELRRAGDSGFERAQAVIDRDQVDDRAPGRDEILKRGPDLPECPDDLVHRAKG